MELIVLLAVTMTVIGLAGRLPEARRVKRELARTIVSSIDRLPDGKVVAVRGIVALLDPEASVVAPLSGRTCVFWRIVFDEVGIGGDFHELGCVETGRPFLLTSPAGSARVVPERPQLSVPGRVLLRRIGDLDDATRNDAVIRLARSACKRPNYPRTSTLRATEYIVMLGVELTIKGWCTREPDPAAAPAVDGNYRGELPTRAVISGSRRARLIIG